MPTERAAAVCDFIPAVLDCACASVQFTAEFTQAACILLPVSCLESDVYRTGGASCISLAASCMAGGDCVVHDHVVRCGPTVK